jgi:glycosyltransferase involved in cell wall biosynthesis
MPNSESRHLPCTVVYLWSEFPGFAQAVVEFLSRQIAGTCDVVYWEPKSQNSTLFQIPPSKLVTYHPRSALSVREITSLLVDRRPDLIVVSGWMDDGYLAACREYKRMHPKARIIAAIDDQWTGSLRQQLGRLWYRIFYKPIFDFMWVAGKPQYCFARNFGYPPERILPNLLSADTNLFGHRCGTAKRFVFAGRLVGIKRLDLLLRAYSDLPKDTRQDWPLMIIGNGDQLSVLRATAPPTANFLPFMQPIELEKELSKGGIGCLATKKDQWGVAVHEYALMGMPMVLSSGVGAATEFLINGLNGFTFETGNLASLREALGRITSLRNEELIAFSEQSKRLGQRITTEISAYSLLSSFGNL